MKGKKKRILVKETPSSIDKLLAVLCQCSMYLGLVFVLPIIVLVVTDKKQKPFLWSHAQQALIFQGTLIVGSFAFALLTLGVGVILLVFLIPLALLANIKAIYKAAIGESYEYDVPEEFRFLTH